MRGMCVATPDRLNDSDNLTSVLLNDSDNLTSVLLNDSDNLTSVLLNDSDNLTSVLFTQLQHSSLPAFREMGQNTNVVTYRRMNTLMGHDNCNCIPP